jgi:hypothetical protein
MKKLLLMLTVLCGLSVGTFAQSSKTSLGFEAGIPVGDTKDVFDAVIGGSLKFDLPVATGAYFTLSAGYNSFLSNDITKARTGKSSFGFVPLKVGVKYYFVPGFFGEGQVGAAVSTQSGGGTAFAYAPGIGYSFPSGFEAGVRYEGWTKDGTTTSQANLRLAFNF